MRGLRQPKRTPVHPTFGYNRASHIKPLPEFGTRHGARPSSQINGLRWQPRLRGGIGRKSLFRPVATLRPARRLRHDEMATPSKPAQKTARAVEGPRAGAAYRREEHL